MFDLPSGPHSPAMLTHNVNYYSYTRHMASSLLSWITFFGGSHLPCCKDIQAALWRSACGEEQSLLPHKRAILGASPLAPVKFSDDLSCS